MRLTRAADDCTVHCWELRDSQPVVHDVLRTDRRQLMVSGTWQRYTFNVYRH